MKLRQMEWSSIYDLEVPFCPWIRMLGEREAPRQDEESSSKSS